MEQELISSPQNEENIKKNNNKFNEKFKTLKTKEFWTCRMYNYFTLKFFKSIGMMIFFVILIGLCSAIEIPTIFSSFSYQYDPIPLYQQYLSNLICYVIVISVIFSISLSGLIIKDEIRNKTMLIFASLPMSRKRMFTEQLLSFLTINTIFIFIMTFISPIFFLFFGEGSFYFLQMVYENSFVDFFKLLFINMVISTIMLFLVLIFNDKAMKIISPFLAIASIIALMLSTILAAGFETTSKTLPLRDYTSYNYFAENAKKFKLNKLNNKYLDLDDWYNSTYDDVDTSFKPNNPFYNWNNIGNRDDNFWLHLQSDSYLDDFVSKLLNKDEINKYNFNDLLSHMKIDNSKLFDNKQISSSLEESLNNISNKNKTSFSLKNNVNLNDYNLFFDNLKKQDSSLANVYETIYQKNKSTIQQGIILSSLEINNFLSDLINKYFPKDNNKNNDNDTASKNLFSYLSKYENKTIYLNDSLVNYTFYPTQIIKSYVFSQVFTTYNPEENKNTSFQKFLNIKKKQLRNSNILFSFNPFLQFYKIGFYNNYNIISPPDQYWGITSININDFNVPLKMMTINKGKDTYEIIYADMQHNHSTLAIWALYIFWTLLSVLLITSAYIIYSKKDFK